MMFVLGYKRRKIDTAICRTFPICADRGIGIRKLDFRQILDPYESIGLDADSEPSARGWFRFSRDARNSFGGTLGPQRACNQSYTSRLQRTANESVVESV